MPETNPTESQSLAFGGARRSQSEALALMCKPLEEAAASGLSVVSHRFQDDAGQCEPPLGSSPSIAWNTAYPPEDDGQLAAHARDRL